MDEVARSVVDVIKETVIVLIDTFAEFPESTNVTDLSTILLERLEKISDEIGTTDVRFSSERGVALEDELDAFLTTAATFDGANGDRNKNNLKHLQIHIKSLSRALDQEWNASLPKDGNSARTQGGQNDASTSSGVDGSDQKTPEKKVKVFEKFTPLNQDKVTDTCRVCGLTFGYRSLINHMKEQHKDEHFEKNPEDKKIAHPLGTCKGSFQIKN